MELGNVNCFFQNSAAVDVEAAAVRAADVAVKAHDAPVHGRHGSSDIVEVSGTRNSSLSCSRSKPVMREASIGMPVSSASGTRAGWMAMTFWHPKMSQNASLMNLTSFPQ